MMEQQPVHPLEYLAVVNRRKWWFIVPLVACLVAGVITWMVWPKTYLSQAAIAVDSPTLPGDLLRGVQSMDPTERQRAVSQLLLSPEVLERVAREEHMDAKKPIAQVTDALRANVSDNISVPNPIGLQRPDPSKPIDLFYLGFADHNPRRAQEITNRLATVFVDENAKQQTARAVKTSDILAQQLADSSKKLKALEDELRARKEQFMGRLPEQVPANVQMVNSANNQLAQVSTMLRGEQDHLQMIENDLQQMRADTGSTSTGIAAAQSDQKHLDDLRTQLAQDEALSYTDKHPDVIRLKQQIKDAEASAGHAALPANKNAMLQADSLYRQKVQEEETSKLNIKRLEVQAKQFEGQIAEYQRRVEAAPSVEQQLTALNNSYELQKNRFNSLTGAYESAKTAEQVAQTQTGESFHVLYAANLPTSPVSPKAFQIFAVAIVAGFVLGAGAALGREFLDRSVHDVRSLQNEFQVPVLAEIPRIAA
jgi:succinoglycan biosynthesis transport protein ExoP